MRIHIKNLLLFLVVFGLIGTIRGQADYIEIPLGLEKAPSVRDGFFPYRRTRRPRIALAMSGGGARGLAQVGVLKVFETQGIPIDGIVGTSMGAMIGGLYSLGYSAAEIESLAYTIEWNDIIRDIPPREHLFLAQKEEREQSLLQLRFKDNALIFPSAYAAGQRLTDLITELVLNAPLPLYRDFDLLKIPFRALATDLNTGEKVVLHSGSIIDALRSSMTIPLLFSPLHNGSGFLVDGGLVQNLPVSEARSLGAEIVIGIDTSSKTRAVEALKAPWEIADQVTTIMQQETVQKQLLLADVRIQPDITTISNTDFHLTERLIRAGEAAALQALPDIEHLIRIMSDDPTDTVFTIDQIDIEGCSQRDGLKFVNEFGCEPASAFPLHRMIWLGRTLYQTGYFESVRASLDTVARRLIYEVVEYPVIEGIRIEGNTVFSDSLLLVSMESRPGEIANFQKGRRDRVRLLHLYTRSGYGLTRISSVIFQNGLLTIRLDEGRIARIHLEGNVKTKPFVVLRELPFREGELLNVEELRLGLENVYSTGYFEEVRFSVQLEKDGHHLTLILHEREYSIVRLGLRYDLERQSKGYVRFVEENVWGLGQNGFLTVLVGHRDRILEAGLWSDRFLNTYLMYRLSASYRRQQFDEYRDLRFFGKYNKVVWDASLEIGQQMRRLGTLSLRLRVEKIRLKPLPDEQGPDENLGLWNITLRSEVDTRDQVPFPTRGKHHILSYEFSAPLIRSDAAYSRLFSSIETVYPITSFLVYYPRLVWGTSSPSIPFSKQFRMGGIDSFIGLSEEALVGKRLFSLSHHLRTRIPWPSWLTWYVILRYDAGGVWRTYSEIRLKDLNHGFGAVLAFQTFFGPLKFGYGRMSEGYDRFYFSAGYSF